MTATAGQNDADVFGEAERTRFRNLLTLAAESPYEGERAAALAAAERLVARFGMTLDEAAQTPDAPPPPPPPPRPRRSAAEEREAARAAAFARFFHLSERFVHADKARREAAMREALQRGLDAEQRAAEQRAAAREQRRTRSGRRRDGETFAGVLLRETSLPLREIADITDLSIYQVTGLKLKMRRSAQGSRTGSGRGRGWTS